MANLNNYVQGKCLDMCSEAEIKMRETERQLHVLEMVPGTEKQRTPKANNKHMVKAFSRSAAGKQITKPHDLRPPDVLLKTISYLLTEVISTKEVPWFSVYNYITDRLMAVRQDMVVQDISKYECIAILQPIVRFHAFAAYKLCEERVANFDPILNNKHLQETLKKLLQCYDSYNSFCECADSFCSVYLLKFRPQFEALYVVFNIGNSEALERALKVPKACKNKILKKTIQISLSYKYGNYVRACRLITQLPALLSVTASLHLPEIRRKAFQVMATAYNSKNLTFPSSILRNLLIYDRVDDLLDDCEYYGIQADHKRVQFTKQTFDCSKKCRPPKRETFAEKELLETDVQSIVLCL